MIPSKLKKYVTSGPHLWVATLLHYRGPLSTKAIWQEYLKDKEVEEGLIKSRAHLKYQILRLMHIQKKLIRAPAPDVPNFKRSGWKVYRPNAFAKTDPQILAKMDPIPMLKRRDLRKYCQSQNIEFYPWLEVKAQAEEEERELIEYLKTYSNKDKKTK